MMYKNDPRGLIQEFQDNGILFVCLDLPEIPDQMQSFESAETLNDKLNQFVKDFLVSRVDVDTMNEEITLPSIFETYKDDFGTEEDIIRFVWNYMDNSKFEVEQIVKVVKKKNMMIKYESN